MLAILRFALVISIGLFSVLGSGVRLPNESCGNGPVEEQEAEEELAPHLRTSVEQRPSRSVGPFSRAVGSKHCRRGGDFVFSRRPLVGHTLANGLPAPLRC